MSKYVRLSYFAIVLAFLALVSCASPTAALPDLGSVANLVATPGGKSMSLTWDAVPNATGYTVFYTNDGSNPTATSTKTVVTGTTLTQTGLDDTLTYKYSVQPTASGYNSTLSASVMAQPLNVITVVIGGAGAGQAVVLLPYHSAVGADWTVSSNYTRGTPVYGTADGTGAITLVMTIDRVNEWGWTVALDNDGSHTITTGDTVWGSGGAGVLTFLHYLAATTSSQTLTYNPWNDRGSGATSSHIY